MQTLTPSQLKLIEILKTDEQCKQLLEKLTFWCRIKLKDYLWEKTVHHSIWKLTFVFWFDVPFLNADDWKWKNSIEEIIWLPLSEHFLRLYCENKLISCYISTNWYIRIQHTEWKQKRYSIKLDNTKDFNSQSNEVYNNICEALESL